MALVKCSECGKQVSDKASACPGCGSPIGGAAAGTPINTIQKTSKKLKAQQLIAGIIFSVGGISLIFNGCYAAKTNSSMSPVPIIMTAIGLVWYFVVKMRIWWHHE
jgi:uncharacterized membrane protein YvbJ